MNNKSNTMDNKSNTMNNKYNVMEDNMENTIKCKQSIKPLSSGYAVPQLSGEYGDVFTSLKSPVVYSPNTDLYTNIYAANITEEPREYMLQASLYRENNLIDQFIITIDGLSWFTVESESVIQLPTTLRLAITDAALVIDLYERETSSIADSVAVALTSRGTEGLEELPQLPSLPPISGTPSTTGDFNIGTIITPMITLIMVVMMMKMMSKSVENMGKEDK